MQTSFFKTNLWGALTVVLALSAIPDRADALDAAYSRKGFFSGIGIGGGVAIIPTDTALGDIGMNLQLGVGATERLTVALNIDSQLMVNNDILMGTLRPGVEVSFFIIKGLYLHLGVGLAMLWPEKSDFAVGMNPRLGIGYETWATTNVAAYISLDMDYYLLRDSSDIAGIGLWLGIRYY